MADDATIDVVVPVIAYGSFCLWDEPKSEACVLGKSAQFPHLYNLAHGKADIFPEFDTGAEDNQKITLPQSSFICVPRRAIPEIDFYRQSNHNKQIIKSMAKS